MVVVLLHGNKRPTKEENSWELQVELPTYLVDRITAAWQLIIGKPNGISHRNLFAEGLSRRRPAAQRSSEQRLRTSLVIDVFLQMENFSRRHFMVVESGA